MKLPSRLLLLLLSLIFIQLAAYGLTRMGTPRAVALPATDLSEMPLQFGEWTCSDPGERDAEVEDRAGAAASVHRIYHSADAPVAISVYVAIWTDYLNEIPHPPAACYAGSGHTILGTDQVSLRGPSGTKDSASLMATQIDGLPVHVLYYYRVGRSAVMEQQELRDIRRTYWGHEQWPPLVKVMLDVRGVDDQVAERLLVDLGQQILEWTSIHLRTKDEGRVSGSM